MKTVTAFNSDEGVWVTRIYDDNGNVIGYLDEDGFLIAGDR